MLNKICLLSVLASTTSLAVVLATSPAHAQEADARGTAPDQACSASMTTAQRLQCFQNHTQLLTAELNVLKEQKEVDAATGESMLSDKARAISVPNVQLIYGFAGKPASAVLLYTDGRSLTAQVGEPIPGGFVVKSITSSPPAVILSHTGTPLTLLMGGGGSSLQSSSGTDGDTNQLQVPNSAYSAPGGPPGYAGAPQ